MSTTMVLIGVFAFVPAAASIADASGLASPAIPSAPAAFNSVRRFIR